MNTTVTPIPACIYKGVKYSDGMINEMKGWLMDCVWFDLDESEIDQLSPIVVCRGVDKHYCGGIASFDFGGVIS